VDAHPVELAHERLDREDEPARAGDVADERDASPWGDRREVRLDDLLRMPYREWDPDPDDAGPGAIRGGVELVQRGVVLVVIGEELVAGSKADRRERRRDTRGRIRDDDHALRIGIEEGRDVAAGGVQALLEPAIEERDRIGLHLPYQRRLVLEDGPR